MKGKFDRDWPATQAQRFVIPLPAVPTCERKKRLAEERDFYAALLMCYEPDKRPSKLLMTWRLRDQCYRILEAKQ